MEPEHVTLWLRPADDNRFRSLSIKCFYDGPNDGNPP